MTYEDKATYDTTPPCTFAPVAFRGISLVGLCTLTGIHFTLQRIVTHCNTLKHTATPRCNTLQHFTSRRQVDQTTRYICTSHISRRGSLHPDRHPCHIAAHCNTLQHTAAPHCNMLQHTARRQQVDKTTRFICSGCISRCGSLHLDWLLFHTATLCDTLQHTATHRNNTLQAGNKWIRQHGTYAPATSLGVGLCTLTGIYCTARSSAHIPAGCRHM